jgi:hypothetical protein
VSSLQVLVQQLERYASEELELQSTTLAALREQEAALFHGDLAAMRANVGRVDARLESCAARSAKRQELLRRFALHFRVAPSTLTLASICTRLGADGEELARIAVSLRETTLAVSRATRRLGALARMHARLNEAILKEVLATQGVDPRELESCGALLDARV